MGSSEPPSNKLWRWRRPRSVTVLGRRACGCAACGVTTGARDASSDLLLDLRGGRRGRNGSRCAPCLLCSGGKSHLGIASLLSELDSLCCHAPLGAMDPGEEAIVDVPAAVVCLALHAVVVFPTWARHLPLDRLPPP
eukprot:361994-Chlamydomonas_euryale.AAC.6